jgi:hypothetical protein
MRMPTLLPMSGMGNGVLPNGPATASILDSTVASFRFPDEIASLSAQSGHDRIGRTAGIGRE